MANKIHESTVYRVVITGIDYEKSRSEWHYRKNKHFIFFTSTRDDINHKIDFLTNTKVLKEIEIKSIKTVQYGEMEAEIVDLIMIKRLSDSFKLYKEILKY